MITVVLTPAQQARADKIGLLRQQAADRARRVSVNGGASTGAVALRNHILGARAEHAFHIARPMLRWNWFVEHPGPHIPDFELGALKVDVKGIDRPHHKLIIQHNDHDDWAYVLVSIVRYPACDILSWAYGHVLKQKEFWADPVGGRAAFFVSQRAPVWQKLDTLRLR